MEDQLYDIVRKGTALLRLQSGYQQNTIVKKLRTLDCAVSPASFSLIVRREHAGFRILKKTAGGIEALILQEVGMQYDAGTQTFVKVKNAHWQPNPVPEQQEAAHQIQFHLNGRVSVEEKTRFIRTARQEVLEVGIRLNAFTNCFISQNEEAYKAHIVGLLARGVRVKGFLLDPDSNEARLYFEDRARAQPFEKDSTNEIKKVIERLSVIGAELNSLQLPGKFEIYQYKHIPHAVFLVVDGETEQAKMTVAPYLYGIRRANCPVLEFHKKDHPSLYRKYWDSLRSLTENARQLV